MKWGCEYMNMLIMSGKTVGGSRKEMYKSNHYYVVIFYFSSGNSVWVYPDNESGSADAMDMYKCCD